MYNFVSLFLLRDLYLFLLQFCFFMFPLLLSNFSDLLHAINPDKYNWNANKYIKMQFLFFFFLLIGKDKESTASIINIIVFFFWQAQHKQALAIIYSNT